MVEHVQRRLAAILAADVVGYSRLMGKDEEATLATLKAYREVIDRLVERYEGRVFGSAGDSVIAEFASPVEAVRCAVAIQKELGSRNNQRTADERMYFRIGVNLGDVIVEHTNLYGDGVNVAARLEALSEPGGVCISRTVHELVRQKLQLAFDDLGDQSVKNIDRPVHAYRVRIDGSKRSRKETHHPRRWRWAAASAILVSFLGVGAYVALLPKPSSDEEHSVPTLVVGQFSSIGGGEQQTVFSAGLTEDLVIALSAETELHIVSGGRPQSSDIATGRSDRDAHYRLEGSVRQVGEKLRITASLVSTESGFHLWGGRYDREAHDTLVVQDEVAKKIVASLADELATSETDRLADGGGRSPFVRGLAVLGRIAERTLSLSSDLFGGADARILRASSTGA